MNRKWGIIAAVIAALFVAAYLGSPYWSARQFREAALAGDAEALEERVDFPAVRERLKSQLTAALTEKMTNDPEMKGNPFAGLGMMLVPTMVNNMVDGYVTPDGIAMMVKRGKAEKPGAKDAGPADVEYDFAYQSLNRFSVTPHAKGVPATQAPTFIFDRVGLFSWKMIRLNIPANAFKPNPPAA